LQRAAKRIKKAAVRAYAPRSALVLLLLLLLLLLLAATCFLLPIT
jgi:hypothetical protein